MNYWTTDTNFERTLAAMDEFRRRFERAFNDYEPGQFFGGTEDGWGTAWMQGFPRTRLFDAGTNLMLIAEVPGISEQEVKVSLQEDRVSLTGTRPEEVPKGYSVHRRERPLVEFNRSFTLPYRIDATNVKAELKAGILILTLPKHPEAQPRQIPISATS